MKNNIFFRNCKKSNYIVDFFVSYERISYEYIFQLQNDRSISNSCYVCKTGLSKRGCKYVAAVCVYINEECTTPKLTGH